MAEPVETEIDLLVSWSINLDYDSFPGVTRAALIAAAEDAFDLIATRATLAFVIRDAQTGREYQVDLPSENSDLSVIDTATGEEVEE